ncbi:hypothetical protein GOV10_00765 [Candidatus Woesearchaeota archaeon]|nr:hypothetical protein [Candidatus Woesearchaeota archaeon]
MVIEIPYAQGLAETLPPHINSIREEFGLEGLIETHTLDQKIASTSELDYYLLARRHHREINEGEDITRYEAHSIYVGDRLVCVVSAAYNGEPKPLSIIAYGDIPGIPSAGEYSSLVVKRSERLTSGPYENTFYRHDFHKELELVKGEVRHKGI